MCLFNFSLVLLLTASLSSGCGGDDDGPPPATDAGPTDAGATDAGPPDTGTIPTWECGDGRREGPETCDDGNRETEECAYGTTACMVCGEECTQVQGGVYYCGDGALQTGEGETCDDGDANSDGWALDMHCNDSCDGVGRYCGDGTGDPEEECEGPGTACSLGGLCGSRCACEYATCSAASPTVVGSVILPAAGVRMHLVSDKLFVVDAAGDVQIIDVSDPTAPAVAGSIEPPFDALDVWASRRRAYVIGDGWLTADVSDASMPTRLGMGMTSREWTSIAVNGLRAYMGDDVGDFAVLTVRNPRDLNALAVEDGLVNRITDLEVRGSDVFLVTNDGVGDTSRSGLRIVDASDSSAPTVLGSWDTPGDPRGVVVSGNYTYVADGRDEGLTIVDISTPNMPGGVGFHRRPSIDTNDVAIAGDFVVLATSAGVEVVDVSTKTGPVGSGGVLLASSLSVEARGRFAFVASNDLMMRVIRLCAAP